MAPDTGIFKPTLTLLAGGALAQVLPLLLAPLLTRLYTPDQFGHYTLIAAVAVNVGVFWPKRGIYRKPGLAVIEFLPAIPAGKPVAEFTVELENLVETASDRLMAEAGFRAGTVA